MKQTRIILCALIVCAAVARAEVMQEVVVKEGDTLWGVANYYLQDPQRWPEILKYNKIPASDMNVILPGMRLKVPTMLIKEHLRAAHLVQMTNDVRFRRKTEPDWSKASIEMELYNDDGLRTLAQAQARVRFASGEILQVDENSLIILKPEKSTEEIDLIAGGVRSSKTRVLSSSSLIAPRIVPRGAAPDFRTKLKQDKTTLVEVYEGIVDVTAQGKTVTVAKGFGTEVKFMQTPSSPRILPPQPRMTAPAPGSAKGTPAPLLVSSSSDLSVNIPVPALDPGGAHDSAKVIGQILTKYRVQVASAPSFASVVVDETRTLEKKPVVSFNNYHLPDGTYFYRIAYVDDLGFESAFSESQQFSVDTTPPALTISSPRDQEVTDAEFIEIVGVTEPGLELTINGKSVTADEKGGFSTALMERTGTRTIAVSVRDRAGNTASQQVVITKVNEKTAENSEKSTEAPTPRHAKIASMALGTVTAVVIGGVLLLIAL